MHPWGTSFTPSQSCITPQGVEVESEETPKRMLMEDKKDIK